MADFTYDTSTNLGKCRLKLGDTKEDTAWFTDAEWNVFIDEAGTVNGAVCLAAAALIGDRARRTRSYSGPASAGAATTISYDDTAQVEALRTLIETYGGLPVTTTLPKIKVTMPAPLPMDDGFDSDDP